VAIVVKKIVPSDVVDQIHRMGFRIVELETALRPFAAAVFNDNGDVTVTTSSIDHAHWLRAYKVLRRQS
jgi:hypothetical protein